jgi:hypothetical protein
MAQKNNFPILIPGASLGNRSWGFSKGSYQSLVPPTEILIVLYTELYMLYTLLYTHVLSTLGHVGKSLFL